MGIFFLFRENYGKVRERERDRSTPVFIYTHDFNKAYRNGQQKCNVMMNGADQCSSQLISLNLLGMRAHHNETPPVSDKDKPSVNMNEWPQPLKVAVTGMHSVGRRQWN